MAGEQFNLRKMKAFYDYKVADSKISRSYFREYYLKHCCGDYDVDNATNEER